MLAESFNNRNSNFSLSELVKKLLKGETNSLAQTITLLESSLPSDQKTGGELLDMILPHTGSSFRIGISGTPGIGKSTFIDAFGSYLTSMGFKVAVLSIDPSSKRTKGSILGDKTRMEKLSKNPKAFIRPSASRSYLGGVTSHTHETILLCEAAGFDVTIVETVGVGQSETMVREMVDYFLFLMSAGSGDELQGIKRGMMEMADHILINKADGENLIQSMRTKQDFQNAIHLMPSAVSGWAVPVELCSAMEGTGIKEVWNEMTAFQDLTKSSGWFEQNRDAQNLNWFQRQIRTKLEKDFFENSRTKQSIHELKKLINDKQISVRKAVENIFG